MKINRFKIFEHYKFELPENSIFFDITKKQKELNILEKHAENMIAGWLKTDFNYFKNKYFSRVREDYSEYVKNLRYELHPWINGSTITYILEIKTISSSWALDKVDFDDLLDYISNPSIYDDKKTYNL